MTKRICTWCNGHRPSHKVEMIVSQAGQARWWCCWVCQPCQNALRDLLDDASSRKNGGAYQLGWWEDWCLYEVDGRRPMTRLVQDLTQEPPAAS